MSDIDKESILNLMRKKAIIRGAPATGAPRNAFEDLKIWAEDDLRSQMKPLISAKIDSLATKHGISKRDLIKVLMRPPPGQSSPYLIEFLRDTLFS